MAHRSVRDPRGMEWEVWEVHPASLERRASVDRRARARPEPDRRRRVELRVRTRAELAHGWLVFQSRSDKRRLVPIPEGWYEASDTEILALLDRACSTGRPRRLIE